MGTPKPSVQWYKDDIEIFSCERIEIKEEEEGGAVILKGTLIIISVLPTKRLTLSYIEKVQIIHFLSLPGARLSDSGNIKCIATNLLGKSTSKAQLMIEGIYIQTIMYHSRIITLICRNHYSHSMI